MTQPQPQKKKRSWYVGIVGCLVACGFGLSFYYSNQPAKQAVNAEAQAQDRAANARAKMLQQQLAEIGKRPTATIDDYIQNTFDAAPIIDEAKSLVPLQIAFVDHFKQEHASDNTAAMTATYALRMFQKDGELLSLMGNEIYCARALQALPSAKRLGYYRETPAAQRERTAGRQRVGSYR